MILGPKLNKNTRVTISKEFFFVTQLFRNIIRWNKDLNYLISYIQMAKACHNLHHWISGHNMNDAKYILKMINIFKKQCFYIIRDGHTSFIRNFWQSKTQNFFKKLDFSVVATKILRSYPFSNFSLSLK